MNYIYKRTSDDEKNKLIGLFNSCFDILRDNEGLTGDKALRNLSYLLILKLIENHFNNKLINVDEYDYDFSHIEDNIVQKHKQKLLSLVRFSNLLVEPEDNLPVTLQYLWTDILSQHPSTSSIFIKGKYFDIQNKLTFKKLIDKLGTLDLSKTQYDVLGTAYEDLIKQNMTGKVLGQFFTQPVVKKLMVELINPQMHPDGTIETCCDPTMGTGGFLLTYLQHVLKQGIKPNWDFIKNQGLYGKEIEPDTYQLATSNMLISSGHVFEQLHRGDSIREPIDRKFDNVLANPPFGIKGLKYDEFNYVNKNQYIPIKTDNAVSLFIQAIIYILKVGGKCAVVIPDGQDLNSNSNTTLILIREYLMKTCDLKEIIYLPAGVFTNTGVKTCVFFFVKKKEGEEVLLQTSSSKNKPTYKISKTHQTTTVKFYEYNPYEHNKTLLVDVPIEIIANNSYILAYNQYLRPETDDNNDNNDNNDNVIWKTLGEIGSFLPKSKRKAGEGNKYGLYPFYTSSQICTKYSDTYDYDKESLIIGTGGNANIKYGKLFSCSSDNFVITIDSQYSTKYVYYYLLNNIELLQKGFSGATIKHISKDYICGIKIPFPKRRQQEEIVNFCEDIEARNKQLQEEIETNSKQTNIYIANILEQQPTQPTQLTGELPCPKLNLKLSLNKK